MPLCSHSPFSHLAIIVVPLQPVSNHLIFSGYDKRLKEAVAEALGNNVQIAKTDEKQPEYYDRQELCRLAHISTCTLWRMESEGLIHKMKFGRRNLYDKEEIDALLASGKLAKYSR